MEQCNKSHSRRTKKAERGAIPPQAEQIDDESSFICNQLACWHSHKKLWIAIAASFSKLLFLALINQIMIRDD